MPVGEERGVLHARSVVDLAPSAEGEYARAHGEDGENRAAEAHLDAVLACSGNDLARVELERGDGMVVLERLEDAA